ncbi:hypothetical protein HK102_013379 [Quaeritorhiza haematococci]|nr:hypothetical protein HK102_013379 [Quaeritorhiza haematococci]
MNFRTISSLRIPLFVVLLFFIVISNVTVGLITWHLTRQSGEQTIQMMITKLQEKYVDLVDNVLSNRLKSTEAAAMQLRELWQDGAFVRRTGQREELNTVYSILKAQTLFVSSMHFTTPDGNMFGWAAIENSNMTNVTFSDPDIIKANVYTMYVTESNVYRETFFDINGKLLWESEPSPDYNATTEPWVQVLLENNRTRAWTRPYQKWVTYATRAVNQTTGRTIMYTAADLSVPFIGQTLSRFTQNDTNFKIQVYVLDTTDQYILGSSDNSFEPYVTEEGLSARPVFLNETAEKNEYVALIQRTLTSPFGSALWKADQVQTLQQQLNGRQLFVTSKRVRLDEKNTWLVVQIADGTDVIRLIDSNFNPSIIALCVVLAVLGIAGFLFSMSIGKTLAGLNADLRKLAKFDFHSVTYLRRDKNTFHMIREIATIQGAFVEAVKEFAQHIQTTRTLMSPMSSKPKSLTAIGAEDASRGSRSASVMLAGDESGQSRSKSFGSNEPLSPVQPS